MRGTITEGKDNVDVVKHKLKNPQRSETYEEVYNYSGKNIIISGSILIVLH